MRYQVEGDDLCIRIPLDAIAANVKSNDDPDAVKVSVKDRTALALALGRELCECEDEGEDFYINRALDDALERVIESADPSLAFNDE